MKPQQQLRKTPSGDCLRACIATLLECNIEKVPDFTDTPETGDDEYPAWWYKLQFWLRGKGYWFLEMHLIEGTPWMPLPFPGLCILFGETKNGVKHAIVGRVDGKDFFPVFNPWPEAEFHGGVAGLGFLIPADPVTMINMGRALERIQKIASAISPAEVREAVLVEISTALNRRLEGDRILHGL